jgi:hypothetical protein
MQLLQLNPPLPLITPKGEGYCHIVIDHGIEHDLQWVVFINETGECWMFDNPDIRMAHNITLGRLKQVYAWREQWKKN